MSNYTVAFVADGTLKQIQVDEIKPSDGCVRCQSRLSGDDELVGVFPFESIEYIVHNEVAVQDVPSE